MTNQAGVRTDRAAAGVRSVEQLDLRKRARPGETAIQIIMFLCAAVSIFTTVGIIVVLLNESLRFFTDPAVSIGAFLTDTVWQPVAERFGILALISATVTTSLIAMLIAAPLGLGAAIYLSEYASPKLRSTLKPILEVLAGVPTVVYGYFAIQFMTPLLGNLLGLVGLRFDGIYNMLSPGVVMGVMIIPLISSMSEDALSAVPRAMREASYGLGATRLETATKVVLPAALSGITAAFVVAISRAFGETMIVTIAAGAGPQFTFNPLKAAETMTGHIARISGGDLSFGTIDYTSIFAIGLTLFLMTLALNIIANVIVRRFREVYE